MSFRIFQVVNNKDNTLEIMSKQNADSEEDQAIGVLNVGTKILRKDLMDQYIRSMGDFKTYYAANMSWALRSMAEKKIDIIICEAELENGGSAYRLKQLMPFESTGTYMIVAIDEDASTKNHANFKALAEEMDANALISSPFHAEHVKSHIALYQHWLKEQEEPWRAHLKKALASHQAKLDQQAAQSFLNAIKAAPGNPIPLCKTGIYFLGKSDFSMSERFLKEALVLRPDYVQALSVLGMLYLMQGKFDEAEKYLQNAQQISPLNPDRLVKLGLLYLGRSAKMCRNSLNLDSAQTPARILLARVLLAQKDYVNALRELEPLAVNKELSENESQEIKGIAALARRLGGIAKQP